MHIITCITAHIIVALDSLLIYGDCLTGIVMKFMLEQQGTLLDHAEAFGLRPEGGSTTGRARLLWKMCLSPSRLSIFLIALGNAFLTQRDSPSLVSQPSLSSASKLVLTCLISPPNVGGSL